MNHPNALAALMTSGIVLSGEQLAQKYLDTHVGAVWSKAIVGAAITVVLYVGRAGVKGTLSNAFGALRAVWRGSAQAPTATTTKAAASK